MHESIRLVPALVCALAAPAAAQVHQLTALQPSGSLQRRFVTATDTGGACAVFGPSQLLGAPARPVLASHDETGALEWAASLDLPPGSPDVHARGLACGPFGGLFVAFATEFADPGLYGVAVYDTQGAQAWIATQATDGPANYGGFVVDELGRAVSAVSLTFPHAKRDIALAAWKPGGQQAWSLHYGAVDGENDDAIALVAGWAGHIVAVGTSFQGSSGPPRITTLFVDPHGTLMTAVPYPPSQPQGTVRHDAVDIGRGENSTAYVLGRRQSSSAPDAAVLVKYDWDGTLLWSRELSVDGSAILEPRALGVSYEGRATICATSHPLDAGRRIIVVQYDYQGNLLWQTSYGTAAGDYRAADVVTWGGNARVVGYGSKGAGYDSDLATLAYEPGGVLRFARLHGGAIGLETRADAIAASVNGTLHVVGYESAPLVGNATVLLRYADSGFQPLGVETHGLQPLVGSAPGGASAGSGGFLPELSGSGSSMFGGSFTDTLRKGLGGAIAVLGLGGGPHAAVDMPLFEGALQVLPAQFLVLTLAGAGGTPGAGSADLPLALPLDPSLLGVQLRFQCGVLDTGAGGGVALSNGLELWIG